MISLPTIHIIAVGTCKTDVRSVSEKGVFYTIVLSKRSLNQPDKENVERLSCVSITD